MLTDHEHLHLLGVSERLSLPLAELAKHYLEVRRDMLQKNCVRRTLPRNRGCLLVGRSTNGVCERNRSRAEGYKRTEVALPTAQGALPSGLQVATPSLMDRLVNLPRQGVRLLPCDGAGQIADGDAPSGGYSLLGSATKASRPNGRFCLTADCRGVAISALVADRWGGAWVPVDPSPPDPCERVNSVFGPTTWGS
jgi:hypothetical protein